jgi:hypothetical protein
MKREIVFRKTLLRLLISTVGLLASCTLLCAQEKTQPNTKPHGNKTQHVLSLRHSSLLETNQRSHWQLLEGIKSLEPLLQRRAKKEPNSQYFV